MKIRFSLRSFLILFTIVTIIMGVRYNQRFVLQRAAKEIEEAGGTVFYRWQKPYVVKLPIVVSNAYWYVEVPYVETLENGQKVNRTRTELAHQNRGLSIVVDEFRVRGESVPEFSLFEFLRGYHPDVEVTAVSIPATSVTKNTARSLSQLSHLETVVLCVEEQFHKVKVSRRSTAEQRQNDLVQLGQDLERAIDILGKKLPDVDLQCEGLVRDPE